MHIHYSEHNPKHKQATRCNGRKKPHLSAPAQPFRHNLPRYQLSNTILITNRASRTQQYDGVIVPAKPTLPESPAGSAASETTESGVPAGVAGGRLGAGLRGRPCEGRRNLHANTTAMANPATAPSDPAL